MGLVTERLYDPSKPLYLSKATKFDGRDYNKGDEAPTKDMSQRTLLKYFRTGLFVHEVRQHKSAVKAEPQTVEKEEVQAEPEVVKEEPKPAPKKRGRAKSKTE